MELFKVVKKNLAFAIFRRGVSPDIQGMSLD